MLKNALHKKATDSTKESHLYKMCTVNGYTCNSNDVQRNSISVWNVIHRSTEYINDSVRQNKRSNRKKKAIFNYKTIRDLE